MTVAQVDDEIERLGGKAAVLRDVRQRPVRTEGPLVRKLSFVLASDLDDKDAEFDDELIEGTFGRSTMAVLYGDSNSGNELAP